MFEDFTLENGLKPKLKKLLKTILVCFTISLKTRVGCFTISLKTRVEMEIYIGLIIAILTMNLSTAILDTANLHRFDNCDFNDEFLTVGNGGY